MRVPDDNAGSFRTTAALAVLAAAPFLALALVKHCPRRWIIYLVCAAMFALQLYLAYRFSLNLWVA